MLLQMLTFTVDIFYQCNPSPRWEGRQLICPVSKGIIKRRIPPQLAAKAPRHWIIIQ